MNFFILVPSASCDCNPREEKLGRVFTEGNSHTRNAGFPMLEINLTFGTCISIVKHPLPAAIKFSILKYPVRHFILYDPNSVNCGFLGQSSGPCDWKKKIICSFMGILMTTL